MVGVAVGVAVGVGVVVAVVVGVGVGVGVAVVVVVGVAVAVAVVVGVGVGVAVAVVVVVGVAVAVVVGVGVAVTLGESHPSSNQRKETMKRIIECENEGGLEQMLGEKVVLFCQIYIYTGKLVGVNATHVELDDAKIVYETGELSSGAWRDAQPLPGRWRVMLQAIESWGAAKC